MSLRSVKCLLCTRYGIFSRIFFQKNGEKSLLSLFIGQSQGHVVQKIRYSRFLMQSAIKQMCLHQFYFLSFLGFFFFFGGEWWNFSFILVCSFFFVLFSFMFVFYKFYFNNALNKHIYVQEFGCFCQNYGIRMFFDNAEKQICFPCYNLDIFVVQSLPLEKSFTSISTGLQKIESCLSSQIKFEFGHLLQQKLFLSMQAWRSVELSRNLDLSPSFFVPFGHI